MKKVVALLISILFVVTLAQAVTLTIIQPEGTVTSTRPAGSRVIFKSLTEGIKWWKVTQGNVEVEDGGFTMPNEDVSVEAMYTGNLITVVQTANGKITPGTVGVDENGSKTFTITPDSGYLVSDVLVDGVSVGVRTSYTFTNVTAPHTITATYGMYGDVNEDGVFDYYDSSKILAYLKGNITLTESAMKNADVNIDGNVNIYDMCIIQNKLSGDAEFTTLPYTGKLAVFMQNKTESDTTYRYQAFATGETKTLVANTFTREGYTFTGWNTSRDGTGTSYANGASYTASGNITLYAQWVPTTYTITYNLDGGTVSGNPTTYTIESNAITLVNPTKDGYNFTGWTGSNGTTPSTTVTIPKGSTGDREYTANWESTWPGWNQPVITTGLTPVNWNGSSWVSTTEANWDYNYNSVATATHSTVAGNGDGKWANAQTADGSLYVWIPRYSYKITSGEHAASQKSWNSLTAAGTAKIEVKFSNGTTDDTTDSYIAHPAFTFGTDELEGIWVAKYEASQGNTTSQVSAPTSSTSVAKSIPGVASWRNISVSNMFDYAYNTYRNADSHLMKNTEWGAIAYLTNAIGRIPYINNSSSYITGNAGGSQNASSTSGTTNAWNTAGGVKASTTHNVYGIYDMSGGSLEYVAAYLSNGDSNLSSLVKAGSKYKEVYEAYLVGPGGSQAENYVAYSTSKKGDAVYETSSSSFGSTSWDGDYSNAPNHAGYPVFRRGGRYDDYSGAGVFYFGRGSGGADSDHGFRVVLTGVQTVAPTTYTITYNLDGGTVSGNPTSYTSADTITLVNPTKEGYNFTGWTGTGLSSATTTVTIPKGSTGDRTYTANWKVANVAPTTPTVTLSSKTTNSFNVRAVSTDANGDSLIYKLYVDGSLKSTSASTQSGTATTLSVTGLGEYTSHNYYVTASDGTLATTSSTKSVRTYCNTFNTKKTCDDCIDGYEKCNGTSHTTFTVSSGCPCYGGCGQDIYSGAYTNYYDCTKCSYQTCINCGFSTPHFRTNPSSPYPLHNNHYKCSTCSGNGYIYTCYHGQTEKHD